ncbi:MAG: putative rane-associated protein [Planctomycetaceae bacterium]|nr:putative rane-associated protein [Planctomycetaceae bacterium]
MEWFKDLIHQVLHLENYLGHLLAFFGSWTYVVMFGIIFAETGLVVLPFLPGDSLLFALGALAAIHPEQLDIRWLLLLLSIAAILGDTVNYWIGAKVGPLLFRGETSRYLNKKHLDRTHLFFERYGGKTIILARFIPIVRTFAPFVAGMGKMTYRRFMLYNVIGGLVWIFLFLFAGYWLGRLEEVKKNFTWVILGIIVVSIIPAVVEFILERRRILAQPKDEPAV